MGQRGTYFSKMMAILLNNLRVQESRQQDGSIVLLITQITKLQMESFSSISHLFKSVYDNKAKISQSLNSALSCTVSKIGEYKTNLLFSIKHSDLAPLSRKQIEMKEGERAQLLGRWYSYEESYKLLFVFRQTFWLTYREGIKDIESDNGWGCMIRTVQMVFAEVLKRHLKLTSEEKDRCQIIGYFSQKREGALSLSSVCQEGRITKRWSSSLEVFSVFKKIMKKYPRHFGFQLQIYTLGVVYQKIEDILFKSYPAMAILTTKVSLESIPEQLWAHFLQLMNNESWVGSVGGVKGQSLYIVGHYNKKVIFLDPHYVQSDVEEEQSETYCCKSPRGIEISELNPSISYCYYFGSREEHVRWIDWISASCQKHYRCQVFEFISKQTKATLSRKLNNYVSPNPYSECTWLNHPDLQIISDRHSDSSEFQLLQ